MPRLYACSFLAALVTTVAIASAPVVIADSSVAVEVSRVYSAVHHASSRRLAPGHDILVSLGATPYNDRYVARVTMTGGPVRVIAFDGRDIKANNPNPKFLLDRVIRADSLIYLPQIPSQAGVVVRFAGYQGASVDIRLTVFRVGERPDSLLAPIQRLVELPIRALEQDYVLPRFKVTVQPCNLVNAYSNPDIIVCTELIAELYEKNLDKALLPILLHELGHTLLYLWGLPGSDNEDMADDFAAAFLAKLSPEYLDAFIQWLEGQDSRTEAIIQLVRGGRHTISVQRARNLRATLAQPDEVLNRWTRLLGPYRRVPAGSR